MMAQSSSRPVVVSETFSSVGRNEAQSSGVSWPAVAAGAFVAAALSLILLSLGTGLGFSAVSPWPNSGASAAAVGGGAIVQNGRTSTLTKCIFATRRTDCWFGRSEW